jgi:hypothetical protein
MTTPSASTTSTLSSSEPGGARPGVLDLDEVLAAIGTIAPATPVPPARIGTGPTVPRAVAGRARPVPDGPRAPSPVYVDGIEHDKLLRHHHWRPILLAYTAAGAVHQSGRPVRAAMADAHLLVASQVDLDWLADRLPPGPLELIGLDDAHPDQLQAAARTAIGARRHQHETRIVDQLLTGHNGTVIVDGPLTDYQGDRLGGVVKTHGTAVLDDMFFEYDLPVGHMIGPFELAQAGTTRWAAMVRLASNRTGTPTSGLVRIEAFDPALIEPLAATCMDARQQPGSLDPRADRHLAPIAACERELRRWLPTLYGLDFGPPPRT